MGNLRVDIGVTNLFLQKRRHCKHQQEMSIVLFSLRDKNDKQEMIDGAC